DISLAVFADLDLGDDVPDEFEIDFRDAHARIPPRAGKRQGHIGFGLAAEIDGSVVNLILHRFSELWLLRKIETTAHDVHRQSRHTKLLLAARIDLRKFGDRRN